MNWKQAITKHRKEQDIQTLPRIKIGRWLFVIANLPLMTAWLYLIAIPMMMPLSPSVWAKSKIINLKERMRLL